MGGGGWTFHIPVTLTFNNLPWIIITKRGQVILSQKNTLCILTDFLFSYHLLQCHCCIGAWLIDCINGDWLWLGRLFCGILALGHWNGAILQCCIFALLFVRLSMEAVGSVRLIFSPPALALTMIVRITPIRPSPTVCSITGPTVICISCATLVARTTFGQRRWRCAC